MEASAIVSITLRATVSPTESPEKVLAAARNVLGNCAYQVEEEGGRIALRSREMGCLLKIHDQLRDRQVRAAANRLLLRMRDGRRVIMLLNRQASTAGVVALCTSATESPLGPLVVEIESDKPETVIEWLTTH
ncbi:MAG: hypothetical protein OK474_05300 [Thaumarchaeota archaeon]|nr:hypothetical protein [Nitrososphaerota archaeon]